MPLNSAGFERRRLADIKADYDQRFTDALGPVNTAPDTVVGQLIGIFAAALDDVEETLQDTYDAMYPASAEGAALDGVVAMVGLDRIGASATTCTACVYGAEGTLLVAGSLTRAGTKQYALDADTLISRSRALDVEITVNTVTNSTVYQIIAGGVLVSYTSDASATASEIAAGLAADFDPLVYTAVANGSTIRVKALDGITGFALTVDTTLAITLLGSPADFTGLELGANALPAGAMDTIDTPTLGWDSVSNLAAGTTGRDVETDTELRTRHASGVRASGSATVKAIRARLPIEVPEITSVQVYENRENVAVDGMPAHSLEAVIQDGATADILAALWLLKPAGIETYGNTSGTITDDNGDAQTVSFSRPVSKYIWVRVSVNSIYTEEVLPATVATAISDAVVATGDALTVGNDVIPQRFYGPIFAATTGLRNITVEVASTDTAGGTPSYSTVTLAMGRTELPVFDSTRVTVVGV